MILACNVAMESMSFNTLDSAGGHTCGKGHDAGDQKPVGPWLEAEPLN
jgi:catalase (peroxidase I)